MRKRESGSGQVMDKELEKSQILILLSILCLKQQQEVPEKRGVWNWMFFKLLFNPNSSVIP